MNLFESILKPLAPRHRLEEPVSIVGLARSLGAGGFGVFFGNMG